MLGKIFRSKEQKVSKDPQLLAEIETASATYERCWNCFNFAETAEQIEAAIYALKSAELSMQAVWKEARQCTSM